MKNVKLIVLTVSAILFLGMGNVNAQNSEPKTVIIRVYEFRGAYKSSMIITNSEGTSKTVELKWISLKTLADATAANNASIQTEINLLKKDGYEIDGLSSVPYGEGIMTTIILSKED